MAELIELHKSYPALFLRRFADAVGVASYRSRDFVRGEQHRHQRQEREQELRGVVRAVALAHPTYGHRPLH